MWTQTGSVSTEIIRFDVGEAVITANDRKRKYSARIILDNGTEFQITQPFFGATYSEFLALVRLLLCGITEEDLERFDTEAEGGDGSELSIEYPRQGLINPTEHNTETQ